MSKPSVKGLSVGRLIRIEFRQRRTQMISGLLAITLGIAVIVAIRSISLVSEKAVAINLDNLGANVLVLPQGATVDNYYTADIDAPTLPEEYAETIATSDLTGVDNMSPKLTRRVNVNGEKIVLTGILPKNELVSKPIWKRSGLFGKGLKASCGPSPLNESHGYKDEKLQRKSIEALAEYDCLVGATAAQKLRLKENSNVTIEGKSFRVEKVLPETGTVDDDRVFAHLHTVQGLLGIGSHVSAIEIMGCCNAITDGLLSKLRNILPDTRVTTIGQIVSTQVQTNKLMKKLSVVFLIIIVFVGAVSIGNSMWANVNERKKEIGTLRMIGFPKTSVYRMILTKAMALGLAGGVLGYAIGSVAAMWLGPEFAGIEVSPTLMLLPASVALSTAVAAIGAAIPAYFAGSIEPFDNMQEN